MIHGFVATLPTRLGEDEIEFEFVLPHLIRTLRLHTKVVVVESLDSEVVGWGEIQWRVGAGFG